MKRETQGAWMFFLVAVASMVAAFVPVFRDRPMNVVFFCVGVVWFILGMAMVKKARTGSGNEGERP